MGVGGAPTHTGSRLSFLPLLCLALTLELLPIPLDSLALHRLTKLAPPWIGQIVHFLLLRPIVTVGAAKHLPLLLQLLVGCHCACSSGGAG